MHFKRLAGAVAFAALAHAPLTTTGFAADYNDTDLFGGYDWTGFYAGLATGYSAGKAKQQTTQGTFPSTSDINGGIIGATIGANYQFNRLVLGIEGDIFLTGQSDTQQCSGNTNTCTDQLNWTSSVRARVGAAFDRLLVFGTAGVAIAEGESTVTPNSASTTGIYKDTFVGWTVGAGAEYAVTERIRFKSEYAYTDLGTVTSTLGSVSSTNQFESKPTYHTVKMGVNFAF